MKCELSGDEKEDINHVVSKMLSIKWIKNLWSRVAEILGSKQGGNGWNFSYQSKFYWEIQIIVASVEKHLLVTYGTWNEPVRPGSNAL